MAGCNLKTALLGESDHLTRFPQIHRKRFFDVNMTSKLETLFRELEVALRRCGDVDDIGVRFCQEPVDVVKTVTNLEAFRQLVGHQLLAVADGYYATPSNTSNLLGVLVGNLATSDDGGTDFVQRTMLLWYWK